MWSLAIFSGWVREIPINWAKRDSTTKEKAKDTQNFFGSSLFPVGTSGRRAGREEAEVKGGKVGRSRGEGRRSRDTIESGTQELKRIKVSRGGAEVEGREAEVEGRRVEGLACPAVASQPLRLNSRFISVPLRLLARPLLRSRYGSGSPVFSKRLLNSASSPVFPEKTTEWSHKYGVNFFQRKISF